MRGRRRLLAIVVLAAALHGLGIARTILPAQDGLKFIRIGREFQRSPAADVIRGSDQHPLYPALIALAEPLVARVAGRGPDTWRVTAQLVAALASLGLLVPLHGLARALFDDRVAAITTLLYVLLPLPAEVGRDTLSDSLALLAALSALRLGAGALATGSRSAYVGCGLVAGLGYLARPEVALVPLVVGITQALFWWRRRPERSSVAGVRLATLGVAFLSLVGVYALVKGEVSEKLALRYGAGINAKRTGPIRRASRWLPPGLDDPRWDFSPKEEARPGEASEPTGTRAALGQVFYRWAEGLGGFLGLFALWGAFRGRSLRERIAAEQGERDQAGRELTARVRVLLTVYLVVFAVVLVRHAALLGYLSDRHLLPLVAVSLPWAAAGMVVVGRRLIPTPSASASARAGWGGRLGVAALVVCIVAAAAMPYIRPGHRSRWGHRAAGDWLRAHARPYDAVLDTRGWAAFVSNLPTYDYWHVRQALTDARLAYVVVGTDELSATSRRAATLRAVLDFAAVPVAGFPDERGGSGVAVQVYRFHQPSSWEGLRP